MQAASRNNGDASMASIRLRFILAKIWEHGKRKFHGAENCAAGCTRTEPKYKFEVMNLGADANETGAINNALPNRFSQSEQRWSEG